MTIGFLEILWQGVGNAEHEILQGNYCIFIPQN
jgi:hypothetical protein